MKVVIWAINAPQRIVDSAAALLAGPHGAYLLTTSFRFAAGPGLSVRWSTDWHERHRYDFSKHLGAAAHLLLDNYGKVGYRAAH